MEYGDFYFLFVYVERTINGHKKPKNKRES